MSVLSDGTITAAAHAEIGFHEAECGGYSDDLSLWRTFAAKHPDQPICDLGSGTGRVALDLANAGHRVIALDSNPVLLAELERSAGVAELSVETHLADAAGFTIDERFGLIIAPMQLAQLLDRDQLRGMIKAAAAHLVTGGTLAIALVVAEAIMPFDVSDLADAAGPLPDVRERDGWVYSSLPLSVSLAGGAVEMLRRRETVSPEGRHDTAEVTTSLRLHPVGEVCSMLAEVGLEPDAEHEIAPIGEHQGSLVLSAVKPAGASR